MDTNKWLRWGIIAGALLALFIPLYVENLLFFPFITGKAFAFRIIVELMAGAWVVLMFREPEMRPRRSYLLIAAGALMLSLLVSVFLSPNPDKSFWSNFERMEGWIGVFHVVLYFAIILSVFAERTWKWWWNTAIAAAVIEGLYGVGQLLGWLTIHQGGVRLDGTFGNATYLAVYMLFSAFLVLLAASWWARGKGTMARFLQAWYAFAFALFVYILFETATRGAILGLVAGLLIASAVMAFAKRETKTLRNWGIGILAGLIVLGGAFYALEQTPLVQKNDVLIRLASIDTPQKLLEQGFSRFTIWQMAWQGFKERPVFGWGQESFNYVFNEYYAASMYAQEPWFDRAHNEFFDMAIAGGIVGLLFYLSLFVLAFYYLWRRGNPFSPAERGLLSGMLVGYAVNNLFVFDNLMSYVYFFSVLAYIGFRTRASGALPEAREHAWRAPLSEDVFVFAAPVVLVLVVSAVYFVNVPSIMAGNDLIQGLSAQPNGLTQNLDYFKAAVNTTGTTGLGAQEVHEQLVQFAGQVITQHAGTTADEQTIAQYAADQMQQEVAAEPNDARTRLFYGQYLLQVGQYDTARTELLAAHKLSPEKQQILFELGILESAAGNNNAALDWLKQAYELAPDYDQARILYAAMAIRTGDMALAKSLLVPRFGTATPDDSTILSAYVAVKDYPDAFAVLNAHIAANPSDYQGYVNLAGIYFQTGDKAHAVSALQKAMQLNPAFKTQGQSLIDQINAH
ncbi:MAG: O-antigen ligase family protein [Patescibacteria group bacterium]|nr:O-antigen ligase family protein [Patescibacteria group bacterium]